MSREQIKDTIEKILDDNGIYYTLDMDSITSVDELRDDLYDDGCLDVEVIYYSNAIKYLSENDPSLHESLEIAREYGFELSNLNSEILASLLASQELRETFENLTDELESLFDQLN